MVAAEEDSKIEAGEGADVVTNHWRPNTIGQELVNGPLEASR
jgi:hypothetical protein